MQNKTSKFIIFTFSISWIMWAILGLLTYHNITKFGEILFWTFFILGGSGPLISAFLVNLLGDKEEYKEFIKCLIKAKVSPLWYLWVILIPLLLLSIPWIVYYLSKGGVLKLFRQKIYMVFTLLPLNIIGGGTEEVGWRGVLLPELLKKYSKMTSTLIVSGIWAVWHLPLWFIKGSPQENTNILFFLILSICLSFLLTILYTRTKSIFLCILFHSFVNSYPNILNTPILSIYGVSVIMLAFCLAIFGLYEKNNIIKCSSSS